jgi:hypothetical protein
VRRSNKTGEQTCSIDEAIKRGYLEVSGSGHSIGFTFKSLDDATYEISFERSLVGAVSPGDLESAGDVIELRDTLDKLIRRIEKDTPEPDSELSQFHNRATLARNLSQEALWSITNRRDRFSYFIRAAAEKNPKFKELSEEVSKQAWDLRSEIKPELLLRREASGLTSRFDYWLSLYDGRAWLLDAEGSLVDSAKLEDAARLLLSVDRTKRIVLSRSIVKQVKELPTEEFDRIAAETGRGALRFFERASLKKILTPDPEAVLSSVDTVLTPDEEPRVENGILNLPNDLNKAAKRALAAFRAYKRSPAENNAILKGLSRNQTLTEESLLHVERLVNADTLVATQGADGVMLSSSGDFGTPLSDFSIRERFGDRQIAKPLTIIDVRQLDSAGVGRLTTHLQRLQQRKNVEFYLTFSDPETAFERFASMHNPRNVSVVVDDSIKDIPATKDVAYPALEKTRARVAAIGDGKALELVEFLYGENSDSSDLIKAWTRKARSGDFKGKHIVAVACNLGDQKRMFDVARVALNSPNGAAASFACANDVIDARAFTLAASKIPEVALDNRTPIEFWKECYRRAMSDLQAVEEADDSSAEQAKRFLESGQLLERTDKSSIRRYIKRDPDLFFEITARRSVGLWLSV